MEIFLRSPNWIGDCVMSLSAIRTLKNLKPDLKILIITKSNLSAVYKNVSEIDEVVSIPSGKTLKEIIHSILKLRKYKIKDGILFPNSFLSALILRLSGVKYLTGYSKDLRSFMLKRKIRFPGKSIHQIKSYMGLIGLHLSSTIEPRISNELVFSSEEKLEAKKILKENGYVHGEKLVGISPAAAFGTSKEWLEDNYINLIDGVSREISRTRFVLFGSKKDEKKLRRISGSVSVPVIIIAGKYTLREAFSVISECDIFVGNDSGLLHVADAARVAAVGLFGPTSPKTTSPPGEWTETIYKGVECSPCSYRICPIDHKCMKNINVSEVQKKVIEKILRK